MIGLDVKKNRDASAQCTRGLWVSAALGVSLLAGCSKEPGTITTDTQTADVGQAEFVRSSSSGLKKVTLTLEKPGKYYVIVDSVAAGNSNLTGDRKATWLGEVGSLSVSKTFDFSSNDFSGLGSLHVTRMHESKGLLEGVFIKENEGIFSANDRSRIASASTRPSASKPAGE